MKRNKIFFLLLTVQLLSANFLNAQWVQSNLNAGLGRSLYSDGTTIYAATSQGVYYTSDIGDPWISIGPQYEDIFSVIKNGNKIIAGSGMGHGVFLSSDNGQTWYQPATLNNRSVYALAKSSTHIFAGTWGAGIFRSADDGETWESAGLNPRSIWDLLVVGNTLFAASPDLYSRIYFTSDNGVTWNYGSLDYPASDPRALFYSDGKLFACDMGLWVSADMGNTWQLQYGVTYDSTGYPVDVMMFRSMTKYDQYLIAGVAFESIYLSSDNGISWTPFNDGLITDWTFADMAINGSYIWALRDFFGNAYRRPAMEVTTNVKEEKNVIDNFVLYQNYPNPFNPVTTIKFSIESSAVVKVTVFDLLGKELKVIVNEYRNAGTHSVGFNANTLPSGVYFYSFQSGNFTQTKKMALLR